MTFERVVKILSGGHDFSYRGLTFVPPDGASLLLGLALNIAEVGHKLFSLLTGKWTPFEEAIGWLKFSYTADYSGAYVAPAYTFLVQSMVSEGDPLFLLIWRHLLWSYPVSCAPPLPSTYMIAPPGPD